MKGSWIRSVGKWFVAAAVTLAVVGGAALAQDFPTLKGDTNRTGKGSSPNTSGPGAGLLNWFAPGFADNIGKKIIVDNLYRTSALYGPDYVTEVGTWVRPAASEEAAGPYIPPTLNQTPPPPGIFFPPSPEVQSGYYFAESIASAPGNDPTAPLNATDPLATFTWTLRNPVVPFYEAHDYAVYVHLPVGPTTVAGVQRFPQDKFVYKISYPGGSYIDIVDIGVAGGGWIRLGNGGLPTDKIFSSDGVTPITVTLYNTVPRDPGTGILTTNPSSSGPDLDLSLPRPIVYADAVQAVPQIGTYTATPIVSQITGLLGPSVRTIGVLNETSLARRGAELLPTIKAVVTSYDFNTGNRRWRFSPLEESGATFMMDNTSAGVTLSGTWATINPPVAANYRGTNYLASTPLNTTDPNTASTVTYLPTLPAPSTGPAINTGAFDIYVWIPGNSNGETFAKALQYDVFEGATKTSFTVDQTVAAGWVRIGSRRFLNDPSGAGKLKLVVTNYSADPADTVVGVKAFSDAVRFVGPSDLASTSTPVQVTARIRTSLSGAPADKSVLIVTDENGKIYCLDAEGRGDGTTDVLWTYPSTRDPDVPDPGPGNPDPWKDPNLNAATVTNPDWGAIDGSNNQRVAEMPVGFGQTSPLVARVGGEDYLYIASKNGRVYCIEMAGRGDQNTGTRKPGTTRRVWTWPDDYPSATQTSTLQPFVGSVAFANSVAGPTIFVPARQGRMYAIDAVGNLATRTTTIRWAYPTATSQTLGPITSTPAIQFGHVYFGTQSKDGVTPGQFLALDQETGALSWTLTGTTRTLSDFDGGPVTVDAALLGGGMPDTVFASNENRGIFAMDATTGTLLWESYEPQAPARAPLTYTVMSVPDAVGTLTSKPVIVVPQSDGRVSVLQAQTTDLTNTGGRLAKGYILQSNNMTAGVSVGWNYMYMADNAGYLYAFTNTAGTFPPGTVPPVIETGGGNTPGTADFSQAKVKFITRPAFLQLRQNTMYYADALDPANELARSPMAFEWGEYIYILVYDFPYQRAGTSVPPVVNVNFSVGGQTIRNVFAESRLFPGDLNNDPSDGIQPFPPDNIHGGYSVISFPLQPAGANALPPGEGEVSIGFNTTDTSGAPINYPGGARKPFMIANPLAILIDIAGDIQKVGMSTQASDPENLFNGSGPTANLMSSAGTVGHGHSSAVSVNVYDRSLVTLIQGPGKGLKNVRVERPDLAWQTGGTAAEGAGLPYRPLDSALFPGFEDLPFNIPNNSLDYPDIGRERIRVVKSPDAAPENPINYAVELFGPTAADGSAVTPDNADTRALIPTPFSFTIDVPLYQPANEFLLADNNGNQRYSGYNGMVYVYVDSSSSGQLDRPNGFIQNDSENPSSTREAFRNFKLALGIPPDIRFEVQTPTLDLGSLAEGTGYTPAPPGPGNAVFNPWTGAYVELFKPFEVANLGNVNLRNLRVAKATADSGNTTFDPWKLYSTINEDLAYLDGDLDLWSDMDPGYAPMRDLSPDAPVILQKARPGDRAPTRLSPNPVPRINPNIGTLTATPRLDPNTYKVGPPRIAVTAAPGFPVGTYSSLIRVIEEKPEDTGSSPGAMAQNLDAAGNSLEDFGDPTLRLIAKIIETRLTSSYSPKASPFVDDLLTGTESFRYTNLQPSLFRHPANGGLVMAMSSNRPSWTPPGPGQAVTNSQWRIFLSSLQGVDPVSTTGTSPLRDLYNFTPDAANNRWFKQAVQTASGFPLSADDAAFFNVGPGESLITGTAKYGSPVFSATGLLDPFRNPMGGTGAALPSALMAFVGEAQIQTATGRRTESKIFVTPVTVDGGGGVGIGDTYAMTTDPLAAKSRPSIVQTANTFYLFYAATIGGRSSIYMVAPSGQPTAGNYDGSYFNEATAIDLGEGFESVSSPSAVGRLYRGLGTTRNVIDLTFSGKLRGRPVNETFYARLGFDDDGNPVLLNIVNASRERLSAGSERGLYVANGVSWIRSAPIGLGLLRGASYTDLEVPNTRVVERDTGIITFNTVLGGKAYLDPSMGTVRLSAATPPANSVLALTYQARIVKVSEGTSAGYTSPSLGIDERLIPDVSYWYRAGDGSPADGSDNIRPSRFLFFYARAAAGAGQAARPVMKTLRPGVELPLPVYATPDGNIESLSITASDPSQPGALQYYQVDPAKGNVYFTAEDMDRNVTITYTAADRATGQRIATPVTITGRMITLITERAEELVQMDQATNETNLSVFLDPFDSSSLRRPGLIWMLWASTRAGSPDVYMQTIAPRFTPVVTPR